jgi:hypothetical protein
LYPVSFSSFRPSLFYPSPSLLPYSLSSMF